MRNEIVGVAMAVALSACSTAPSAPGDSATLNKINEQMRQAAMPAATHGPVAQTTPVEPIPAVVANSLLPKQLPKTAVPKTTRKSLEQRFDLLVKDTPISQVLAGIVSDTPYSILVKPKASVPLPPGAANAAALAASAAAADMNDKLTVNLKNVTMFEALDAVRDVYGYEYTVDGNRIYVQQPELQTRLYQVNYVVGQRRGVSDLQVISGASSGGSSNSSSNGTNGNNNGSSGSTTGASFASVQASALSSSVRSDLWGEVEDAVRTTLGCVIPRKAAATTSSSGGSGGSSSSSSGTTTTRADVSFSGDSNAAERQRGVDGCADGRAMTVNPMSGTVLVRGMPSEHRLVVQMLRSMQLNIDRQVIIESKIIDVELNSGSQQGINWADFQRTTTPASISLGADTTRISSSGVAVNSGTSLGELLGTGLLGASGSNAFSSGIGLAVRVKNFSALLNFMQTQGQVHVLSSPRISTLNSQKAVIKVGSEEPFVTSISGGTSANSTSGIVTTPPTLNYQPFFSGIALDVTPHIDDKDNITLHVHSMVTSITEKEKISQPSAGAVRVPFAVNTISETDSVVKTRDGQVIVIGGLMTESSQGDNAKVPGAGDVLGIGALFRKTDRKSSKRELVILLKPTVVKDDAAWADDIAGSQARISNFGASAADEPK